ncbi:hypothetical protein LG293_15850 (plasmid) [Citricoccus nitrophenolicus]
MSSLTICQDCLRIHSPDWVRVTGRFSKDRKFRGQRTGRWFATRAEGMAAECQAWQEHDAHTQAEDAVAEAYFGRQYQRVMDGKRDEDGLLDPDQPTATAHTDHLEQLTRPFDPDEYGPRERMLIRSTFQPKNQEQPA